MVKINLDNIENIYKTTPQFIFKHLNMPFWDFEVLTDLSREVALTIKYKSASFIHSMIRCNWVIDYLQKKNLEISNQYDNVLDYCMKNIHNDLEQEENINLEDIMNQLNEIKL